MALVAAINNTISILMNRSVLLNHAPYMVPPAHYVMAMKWLISPAI